MGTPIRYIELMGRRKQAFLVTLWREDDPVETAPTTRGWQRGSVQHLKTRQRLYFTDITELLEFLASWAGRRDPNNR